MAPVSPVESGRALSDTEWCVLGAVCAQPAHGWAIARTLRDGVETGVAVSRPEVYRTLRKLAGAGLVKEAAVERSARGPYRTIFAPTPAGRARFDGWLGLPVERLWHPSLLVKIALAERVGLDAAKILASQRVAFTGLVESLEERLAAANGSAGVLLQFQLDSTRAALALLDASCGKLALDH